jgi:hypothetical protein
MQGHRGGYVICEFRADAADVERLAIYLEVAAALRVTGERGSEVAALLVEQLADELATLCPCAGSRR